MKIEKHLDIRLTDAGIRLLDRLPAIDEAAARKLDKQDIKRLLRHYAALWGDLVRDGSCPATRKISVWRRAFSRVGQTTRALLREYLRRSKYRIVYDSFLTRQMRHFSMISDLDVRKCTGAQGRFVAAYIMYWAAIDALVATALVRLGPPGLHSVALLCEASLRHFLAYLSISVQTARSQEARLFFVDLLCSLIQLVADVLSKPPMLTSDHVPGIFSELRPDRLAFIAERHVEAVRVYGDKGVEKALERQLALLLQSIGFFVIPTKTGMSTADLLCLSPDPRSHFTFLVEAKTSRRPYALPRKDCRALEEYVKGVTKHLGTLPPLRFVLMVGPSPASTLRSKMVSLQKKLGLPARYVAAQDLASFRERLSGYLSHDAFEHEILSGEVILSGDDMSKIIKKCESQQKAHSDFIENLLSTTEIRRQRTTK